MLRAEAYENYLLMSRITLVLLTGQNPFVHFGDAFSFNTEGWEDRAREIGGHPSDFEDPPFDYTVETGNPFLTSYKSELELIRQCHSTQRHAKRHLLFLNKAYNVHGQVVNAANPHLNWNFHVAMSPVHGNRVNACYPGNAKYLPASAGQRIQDAVNNIAQDYLRPGAPRHDDPPARGDFNNYPSPAPTMSLPDTALLSSIPSPPGLSSIPSPPGYSPVPSPSPSPELPHKVPQPTPVNDLPGEIIQQDLGRLNAEADKLTIDPRLTELGNQASTISLNARFIHSQYDPQVDRLPFQEDCACKLRKSFQSAYVQGRKDEYEAILLDNRSHGFVALRTNDFVDFASRLDGQLEAMPMDDYTRGHYNAGSLVHHPEDTLSSSDSEFSTEAEF
jgi:hypothetical protein